MKRHSFAAILTLMTVMLILSACAPATPQIVEKVVKETVVVEKQVAQTVVVEKAVPQTVVVEKVVEKDPRRGGTVTFGYPQKTSYSNLFASEFWAGVSEVYLRRLAFSGLVQVSQDFSQFNPDLAERWEFDGNTCTFYLRKDVKWHDGIPFTAKDVLFTFRVVGSPLVKTLNGVNMIQDYIVGMKEFSKGEAKTISGITAKDDYTVVFQMPQPYRDVFLAQINSFVIVPEHILAQLPEDKWGIDETGAQGLEKTDFAMKKAIGTGPFKITNYVQDQYVEYEAYADYHRGQPLLDKVIFRVYANAQAEAAAVESGECDIALNLPESEYERLSQLKSLRVLLSPSRSNMLFELTDQPYLHDVRVRQALSYALDRDKLSKGYFVGTAPASPAPFLYSDYGVSPKVKEFLRYDPEQAKKLLKEAGWDPTRKLTMLFQALGANEPYYSQVRKMWEDVGVQSEYKIVGADYANSFACAKPPCNYDLAGNARAWGLSPADGVTILLKDPYSRWPENTEGMALLSSLLIEKDPDKIKAGIWKLQEMVIDDSHYIFALQMPGIHAVNKRVKGDITPVYATWTRNDWGLEKIWVE